jgi:hypothetical protein
MTELLTSNQPDLDASICNCLGRCLIPTPGRKAFAAFLRRRRRDSPSPRIYIQRAIRITPCKKHYITLCDFDTNYRSQVLVHRTLRCTCSPQLADYLRIPPFLNPIDDENNTRCQGQLSIERDHKQSSKLVRLRILTLKIAKI